MGTRLGRVPAQACQPMQSSVSTRDFTSSGSCRSVDDDTLLEEIAELFYTAHGITLTVPDMSRAMLQMNQTYKSVCISAGGSGYGPGVLSDHLAFCCPPTARRPRP